MNFESQNHTTAENPIEEKVAIYREQKHWAAVLQERSARLAKMALVSLSLHGAVGASESNAQTSESNISIEREVPITLADGTEVVVPVFEGMKPLELHLPENQAPHRLVMHFPQFHVDTPESLATKSPIERWRALIYDIESQRNIYAALATLAESGMLTKVCVEGLIDDDDPAAAAEAYRKYIDMNVRAMIAPYLPNSDIAKADEDYKRMYADDNLSSEEYTLLTNSIDPVTARYIDEYKYIIGGAELLAAEGKITLCAAETRAGYDAAWTDEMEALRSKPTSNWSADERTLYEKVVIEDREDASLERIASEGGVVTGLTFGVRHQYSDTLDRWNDAHKNNTFGIVSYSAEMSGGHYWSELVGVGFTFEQIVSIQYAFKLKPWASPTISEEQFTAGMKWLTENGQAHGIDAERIKSLEQIIQRQ